jgi:hypothetical protein
MLSIIYTELQKPLRNLSYFDSLFFKNYLQRSDSFCTICTCLSQNLMQTHLLGTPKLPIGQHVCIQTDTTTVQSHVPQPHFKTTETTTASAPVTVCASSSSAICRDDILFCYHNSVISYTNTTTVVTNPFRFYKIRYMLQSIRLSSGQAVQY